jgi:hypothetical protein
LRRLAKGAKRQADSISRTKPWIAAGFNTRRTWERNGKPNVATSRQVKIATTERELATQDINGSVASDCVSPSTADSLAEKMLTRDKFDADVYWRMKLLGLADYLPFPELDVAA